jgi:hypothetical protein
VHTDQLAEADAHLAAHARALVSRQLEHSLQGSTSWPLPDQRAVTEAFINAVPQCATRLQGAVSMAQHDDKHGQAVVDMQKRPQRTGLCIHSNKVARTGLRLCLSLPPSSVYCALVVLHRRPHSLITTSQHLSPLYVKLSFHKELICTQHPPLCTAAVLPGSRRHLPKHLIEHRRPSTVCPKPVA